MSSPQVPEHFARAARHLLIDRQSVEIIDALERAGVASLLLKGPALEQRLYSDGVSQRDYGDADILVPPGAIGAAGRVLRSLGYRRTDLDPEQAVHATTWGRPGETPDEIDLHHTLPGGVRDAYLLWDALWEERERITVSNRSVPVLGPRGTALLLALHVERSLPDAARPPEDLRRGIAHFPPSTWHDALVLARAAGVAEVFACGLRTQAPALADEIGAPDPPEDVRRLLLDEQVPGSTALQLVMTAGSGRQRFKALSRRVVPPPAFVRMTEDAGPGVLELAAAYGRRWRRLAVQAPAAVAAWDRAQRMGRGSRGRHPDSSTPR